MNHVTRAWFTARSKLPSATLLLLFATLPNSAPALGMTDMVVDSISAHPQVKEKIHVYRQVVSDQRIAAGGWLPSVDLEASTGSFDRSTTVTGAQDRDYNSTTYELSVTQNLFNGFDTTYQIEQADARALSALYDVYDTADNIALQAVQAYLEVIKQRRLYRLAHENVNAHKEILLQIRDRNRSGVGRRSQLQQTEGRLARAQASMIAQQNNLADSATLLHQILGRYIDPETLSEPELPTQPGRDIDELIDQALVDHPAMRVASHNVAAAQADQLRSLSSNYPNLDIELATEHGEDVGGIIGEVDETRIMLNLTYNLYRGGQDRAEQSKKVSALYEQKEFAAGIRRQVINSLRLSWTADELLVKQLEFLEAHVERAGETVESYREEFFIGQRDLVDLLNARNELNTAKNQQAEALYDFLAARYRVYEGIGRLFEAADVDFEISQGGLRVARLETNRVDKLPLPVDEDKDLEEDPMDHCDNTLPDGSVNPYGCATPSSLSTARFSPSLQDDYFEIEVGSALVITPAQLMANDIDADVDQLKVTGVTKPEVGHVAFNDKNELVYRAPEGFTGTDSFNYRVTDPRDNSIVDVATVRLRVRETDRPSLDKIQLVNFKYKKTELTDLSKARVRLIIDQLKQSPGIQVDIYTHTDDIGSESYNLDLSIRRAQALKALLVDNGVDPASIKTIGMGEDRPMADNSTLGGKAINRRAEFVFRISQ